MTNVIPFAVRAEINPALSAVATGRTAASVVADLVSTVEQIRDISERVLPLPYDARDVERTIQALLDAISAIEHANAHRSERRLTGVFGSERHPRLSPTSEAR